MLDHIPPRDPPDDIVKNRCKKYAEESDPEHPEKYGGSHRLSHLCASARRKDERHDAKNESEAGHEDGTQAQPSRLDGRLGCGHPGVVLLLLLGEFHDEHRVLHAHASQHHEPDLREDIVVHVPGPHAGDAAEQTHGHDEDDGGRKGEALIFRRVSEPDEKNAERKDEERRIPGWIQKPLACDFIAYAYAPTETCYLLPVVPLQRAWRQRGREWIVAYGTRRARNPGYVSVGVPVPRDVLMQAIVDAMRVATNERRSIPMQLPPTPAQASLPF